jgi:hypothetical protein
MLKAYLFSHKEVIQMNKIFFPMMLIFIITSLSVCAFTVNEQFNTPISSSTWTNRSVAVNMTFDSTNYVGLFAGNSSGSVNYNSGAWISTKDTINATENGVLQYSIKITTAFPNNAYFYGGIGLYGVSGASVIVQGNTNIYIGNMKTGLIECSGDKKALDTNTHLVKIEAARSGLDTLYNIYWDGALWCAFTQANTITPLPANFTFFGLGTTYHAIELDNVYFTDNATVTGLLNLGEYCGHNNAICVSGSCQYGYCALKGARNPCVINDECLSGVCSNGACTQAGIWQQVNYAKDQQLGTDTDSNNFIAMFLMIGIAVMCIVGSRGSMMGVAVGGGLFFVMGVFFTIVGWLSPFILVGMLFVGLALIVLLWIMNGG